MAEDPVADVLLLAIGGSSVTLRLLWWSSSERGEYLVIQDRVLMALRAAFGAHGVKLA